MTAQPPTFNGSNPALYSLIAQQIANSPQQRITFAEYMDWALYHPQHGYYAIHPNKIGMEGDFVTSPHLSSDFGELLAAQFAQIWEILGYPAPFHLVEMGAGQGVLACDILRHLHRHHFDCFAALEYLIVEKSAALIAEQRQNLANLFAQEIVPEKVQEIAQEKVQEKVQWRTWAEIPSNSIVGCCFSNELPDAFPVHQIVLQDGTLQEIYVTLGADGKFQEAIAPPSTPQLTEYFRLIDIDLSADSYPDGYRSEVNLAALDWLKTVSDRLQRGYLLTIDYGYPAHRYYSPTRNQGTLQCYYQHAHHSDPYIYIGQQDLTAHVNFTALEKQGERCHLQTIGSTQQGLFLMALGLGDRLTALSNPGQSVNDILRRRDALHALMNPMGLGNFMVLIQSKGLTQAEQGRSLQGLEIPPMA